MKPLLKQARRQYYTAKRKKKYITDACHAHACASVRYAIAAIGTSYEVVCGGVHARRRGGRDARHVRLAYQQPASSTFLSQQTSHQQPASSTFLSEQISTIH
jgi:hypothetical protein